jgi:hypothetical protein
MHRKAIVQGLMDRLRDSPDVRLIDELDYQNANKAIRRYGAKGALIEAAESGQYGMIYCLTLCKQLRKQTPECKLLLMCPEQDEQSVKLVVDAKWEKQIDDFVFYDVTLDYLASKLISI